LVATPVGKKLIIQKCRDGQISLSVWITCICDWPYPGQGKNKKHLYILVLGEIFDKIKCLPPKVCKNKLQGWKQQHWWGCVLNRAHPPRGEKGDYKKTSRSWGWAKSGRKKRFFIRIGNLSLIPVEKFGDKNKIQHSGI